MMLEIKILRQARQKSLKEINSLLLQVGLTSVAPRPMSLSLLKNILKQDRVSFIVAATHSGEIVGIVVLYFVRIPSGLTAVLEDLVVDEKYRKWGVGRLLVEKTVEIAKSKQARHLSLRTNPIRTEANKLYQALGFNLMKTNFYRINLFK